MDSTQFVVTLLSSGVVGAVAVKLVEMLRDYVAGRAQKKRDEVDRAAQEAEKERRRADEYKSRAFQAESWSDVIEEEARLYRRMIIEAPCLDPNDLPPFPHKPFPD